MHLGPDGGRIDIGNSGIEVAHGGERFVHVFRVERRRKAILNVVSYRDGIFEIVAGDDRHDGAEDFFLGDAHLGIDVDEHRRLHEPAVLIFAFVEALTAADHSRAFVFADVDIVQVSLQLSLVNCGTHVHALIQAIADPQPLGTVHVAFHELVVDALLHDDAAGRGAPLASGAEAAPQSAVDGEVKVRVIEDDHRILAAEFERAVLEALGCSRAYDATYFGRASQRYGPHLGVFHQRRTDPRTESAHDVDDASGHASVAECAH